jgi:hypothetical protein
MRIATIVLAGLVAVATAADPVETEIARYQEAAARLQKAFDEGAARERARSLPTLVGIAKRETAQGDTAGAAEAWKLVLALDPQQEDARKFFTGTNQLDAVLAELAKHEGPLIGKGETTVAKGPAEPRIDMSGARSVRASASFNTAYTLGSFKRGTVLIFQYVSGTWSSRGSEAPQSPDAAETSPGNRLQLFIDSGNETPVLTEIPAGTAAKPFVYTLERDAVGLSLRISARIPSRIRNNNNNGAIEPSPYNGEVKYLVKVIPP